MSLLAYPQIIPASFRYPSLTAGTRDSLCWIHALMLVQLRLNSGFTLYFTSRNCPIRKSLMMRPPKSKGRVSTTNTKKAISRMALVSKTKQRLFLTISPYALIPFCGYFILTYSTIPQAKKRVIGAQNRQFTKPMPPTERQKMFWPWLFDRTRFRQTKLSWGFLQTLNTPKREAKKATRSVQLAFSRLIKMNKPLSRVSQGQRAAKSKPACLFSINLLYNLLKGVMPIAINNQFQPTLRSGQISITNLDAEFMFMSTIPLVAVQKQRQLLALSMQIQSCLRSRQKRSPIESLADSVRQEKAVLRLKYIPSLVLKDHVQSMFWMAVKSCCWLGLPF